MLFKPASLSGNLSAAPSKSDAHRALICAALSKGESRLLMPDWRSGDLEATIRCLGALGANITREDGLLRVEPMRRVVGMPVLGCGESGSTLRFLLPVVAALGHGAIFIAEGGLPGRPLRPLLDCLRAGGARVLSESPLLALEGSISSGTYRVPGDVSSQFISGLLFALPLLPEGGEIEITSRLESAGYVEMTLRTLERFSVEVIHTQNGFRIPSGQSYRAPERLEVEGDWSNMAFFLGVGALRAPVACDGLSADSKQGDRAVLPLLERFGARVEQNGTRAKVSPGVLRGIEADMSQIPDLAPILATVASVARGTTRLYGAGRLRMKESDRLRTVSAMLRSLGADITEEADSLVIEGRSLLRGGLANSCGDHRIAMAAAMAATVCSGDTVLEGAGSVSKSYPSFYDDYKRLGGSCNVVDAR